MWHEWTTQLRGLRLDWGCAAALTLPVMHMPTDEPHKRPASHTFLNTHTPTNKGTPLWMHKVATVRTRTHKRTHRGIICATEFWTLRVRRRLKNSSPKDGKSTAERNKTHTHTHLNVSYLCVEQHIEQHLSVSVLRGWADSQSNEKEGEIEERRKNKRKRWGGEQRNKEQRKRGERSKSDGKMKAEERGKIIMKETLAIHDLGHRAPSYVLISPNGLVFILYR